MHPTITRQSNTAKNLPSGTPIPKRALCMSQTPANPIRSALRIHAASDAHPTVEVNKANQRHRDEQDISAPYTHSAYIAFFQFAYLYTSAIICPNTRFHITNRSYPKLHPLSAQQIRPPCGHPYGSGKKVTPNLFPTNWACRVGTNLGQATHVTQTFSK